MERIYQTLANAAAELNAASDELAKPIRAYESALKALNLGVSAWVELTSGTHGGYWWDRGVGYTKFKDGWGIALRTREGSDNASPEEDSEEIWRFTEAPRWMRIEAVCKLPDLLKALLKQAEETTKKIKAKIAQANEIAGAIRNAAQGTAPQGER